MSMLFQRKGRAAALLLTGALVVATFGSFGGGQQTLAQSNGSPLLPKATGKLTSRLEQLAQPSVQRLAASAQADALGLPERGAGSLLRQAAGAPLVYIRMSTVDEAGLATLRDAGAQIVHVANQYKTVTAYVAPDRLQAVASIGAVENMREELTPQITSKTRAGFASAVVNAVPRKPVAQVGCPTAITSEGDAQLRADQARTTYGVNGAGITVGVLSDSFGRATSPTSVQQDIASGDLPGPGNPCGRLQATNVISESTQTDSSDEGRAMAQIVHDLAPDANLAFATAFEGLFQFADNIRNLRTQARSDVIVDDIAYFREPFYQDGPITLAIDDVTRSGATYFTSAGNDNEVDANGNPVASYETNAYRPVACPALPNLTAAQRPRDCHSFNPAGADPTNGYGLAPGASFTLIFQWAQPWYGVNSDFDIFLVDSTGRVISGSNDENTGQNGTQEPTEIFQYRNTTGANQSVSVVVGRYSGTAAPRFKTIFVGLNGLLATEYNGTNNTVDTFGPTIYGHAAAANALSIAAVPFNDATTPEPFTSRGPAVILFGPTVGATPAAPLAAPSIRNKPDVAATDGNRNTFFGQFSGGFYRFFGTSAAAPHAAAVAALMKQRALQTGKFFFQNTAERLLETTAAQIPNGAPTVSGAGLVNALAAVSAIDALPVPQRTSLPLASFGVPLGTGGPPPPPTPADLVVTLSLVPQKTSFTATEPVVLQATVTNRGGTNAPAFWVDLFINPRTPPTAANTIWNTECSLTPCYGIAWGVRDGLRAGESITLTSQPGSFNPAYSIWPGRFAPGTTDVYVYADSWNPGVAAGAVPESDETNNRAQINGLTVTGTAATPRSLPVIPQRPVRPE